MAAKNQTQVDRWLKRLKNNRVVAVIILVGVVLAGIAQFTKSVGDVMDFTGRYTNDGRGSQQQSDVPSATAATGVSATESVNDRPPATPAAPANLAPKESGRAARETETPPRADVPRNNAAEPANNGKPSPRENESTRLDRAGDDAKPALTQPSPCAAEDGSAAVRAYALALVDPEGLGAFVRQKAELFAVDGAAIRCFQVLSSKFREKIKNDSSASSDLSKIFDLAPDLANRYESQRDPAISAVTWERLSKVLPAMAAGDDAPYHASFPAVRTFSPELKKALSDSIEIIIPSLEDYVRVVAKSTTTPLGAR